MRFVSSLAVLVVLAFPRPSSAAEAKADKPPTPASKEAPFACTLLLGVSVTGDWFGAGFEGAVDGNRWEVMAKQHGFVELWADPKNAIWTTPVTSPCAKGAATPDRAIFTGVNWQFKTAEEWAGALTKVVQVIHTKYPSARRIELLTMLRGPKNQTCGDPKTVVAPEVDQAIAKVSAANPTLVHAAPKFEVASCDVFTKGGPHYTPAGMAAVAKVYAAHYAHER